MAIILIPVLAFAHCDTLDGPVVADAKIALEKADVTPVLKWVQQAQEPEVKSAFEKALAERSKDASAKEKADTEFFETLVRIHRQSEGASFEGLKPSGTAIDPAIVAADKALANGSADALVQLLAEEINKGVRERFNACFEAAKHKDESVEAGRAFVAAYVEFTHFVERISEATQAKHDTHLNEEEAAEEKRKETR